MTLVVNFAQDGMMVANERPFNTPSIAIGVRHTKALQRGTSSRRSPEPPHRNRNGPYQRDGLFGHFHTSRSTDKRRFEHRPLLSSSTRRNSAIGSIRVASMNEHLTKLCLCFHEPLNEQASRSSSPLSVKATDRRESRESTCPTHGRDAHSG